MIESTEDTVGTLLQPLVQQGLFWEEFARANQPVETTLLDATRWPISGYNRLAGLLSLRSWPDMYPVIAGSDLVVTASRQDVLTGDNGYGILLNADLTGYTDQLIDATSGAEVDATIEDGTAWFTVDPFTMLTVTEAFDLPTLSVSETVKLLVRSPVYKNTLAVQNLSLLTGIPAKYAQDSVTDFVTAAKAVLRLGFGAFKAEDVYALTGIQLSSPDYRGVRVRQEGGNPVSVTGIPAAVPTLGNVSLHFNFCQVPVIFPDREVAVHSETDANGLRVWFDLGNSPQVETAFWAGVRAAEVQAGLTIGELLDPLGANGEVSPSNLPSTINPAWFAIRFICGPSALFGSVAAITPLQNAVLAAILRLCYFANQFILFGSVSAEAVSVGEIDTATQVSEPVTVVTELGYLPVHEVSVVEEGVS